MSRSVELQPIQTRARNRNSPAPYTPSPLFTTFNEADIRPPTAARELNSPTNENTGRAAATADTGPAGSGRRVHVQADSTTFAGPAAVRRDNSTFAGNLSPTNEANTANAYYHLRRMDAALLNDPPSIAGSTPPPQYERYYSGPILDDNGVPRNSETTSRPAVGTVNRAYSRTFNFLENVLGLQPGSIRRPSSGTIAFVIGGIVIAGLFVGLGAIVVNQVKRKQ